MRRISDTIARLAAQRSRHGPGVENQGTDRLSDLSAFGSNPGALRARFYLPETLPEGAPLVVVLHGCTQNAAGYDHNSGWSQLADEAGFALLFPEQQRTNNPNLCFNWFLPGDTTRDRGEALSIRQMVEAMVVTYGLDRRRIFATGLSAGGAMVSTLLAVYPETFAGGGIIAGLPHGSAATIPEAFDRMRGHAGPSEHELQRLLRSASPHDGTWPRISIWHGSADLTVAPSNAEALASQWREVHDLERGPIRSESTARHTKQVWCNVSGEAMVEINTIAGMGHGTPLGSDDLGTPGPFMLDAGVSSTREIARFWEIAGHGKSSSARAGLVQPSGEAPPRPIRNHENMGVAPAPNLPRAVAGPSSVKDIIEDALRAAGLMR